MEKLLYIIITIPLALIYAELVGYFTHILIHSEKVPSLSRAHMLHHLRDYGPTKPFRTEEYIESSRDRASFFGGIGFEWFVPLGIAFGVTIGAMILLGVPAYLQVTFSVITLAWGYIAFSYMHSAMHIKGFWMLKNRFFKKWFLKVRRLHDIHHNNVYEDGRMMTNFGICYFGFDRLFRSFANKVTVNPRIGFKAADKRYSYIYD